MLTLVVARGKRIIFWGMHCKYAVRIKKYWKISTKILPCIIKINTSYLLKCSIYSLPCKLNLGLLLCYYETKIVYIVPDCKAVFLWRVQRLVFTKLLVTLKKITQHRLLSDYCRHSSKVLSGCIFLSNARCGTTSCPNTKPPKSEVKYPKTNLKNQNKLDKKVSARWTCTFCTSEWRYEL